MINGIGYVFLDFWQTAGDDNGNTVPRIKELVAPEMDWEDFVNSFDKTLQTREWDSKTEAYEALCDKLGVSKEYASQIDNIFQEGWATGVRLYEDVKPTIEALHERGIKVYLVSNTDCFAQEAMDSSGISDIVDGRILSYKIGYTKPAFEVFEAALEKAGASKEQSLFLGDALTADFYAPRAFGMHSLLMDREDKHPEISPRLKSMDELIPALKDGLHKS